MRYERSNYKLLSKCRLLVEQLHEQNKFSLNDLAILMGVSFNMVRNVLSGQKFFRSHTGAKLDKFYEENKKYLKEPPEQKPTPVKPQQIAIKPEAIMFAMKFIWG